MKKTIRDISIKGKRALVRVDFNVPIKNGVIQDDTRITEALGTIRFLIDGGAKVILCSHLGRPDGQFNMEYSLLPVFRYLKNIFGENVFFGEDVIGTKSKKMLKTLKNGQILLLENLRFFAGEEEDEESFTKQLAAFGDFYVLDAFGTAHRKHASTYGISKYLNGVLGFLVEKEIKMLSEIVENPQRPFVAVLGGIKVKDKIRVIDNLLKKADSLIIGGAMAYTFLKAEGKSVGKSVVDNESLSYAKAVLELADKLGKKIYLPVDHLTNLAIDSIEFPMVEEEISSEKMGLDIGPESIRLFEEVLFKANTVIWNGPMGAFEDFRYENGTREIACTISKVKNSIVGGGDSVSAVNKWGLKERMLHVSTGGGASLKLLEGEPLVCMTVIGEK